MEGALKTGTSQVNVDPLYQPVFEAIIDAAIIGGGELNTCDKR
jgi:hypothetical protein